MMGQRTLIPKTRTHVRSDGVKVAGTTQSEHESFSWYRKKMELRQLHKRLRAGLVVWENLSAEEKGLLRKYYGYNEDGMQL